MSSSGRFLRSWQTVNLIVSTVFFFDRLIVVQMIQFAIFETVFVLFCFCLSVRMSAKVSQKSTVRTFYCVLSCPLLVLCLCPLYRILRRTVRVLFVKVDVLPSQTADLSDTQACIVGYLHREATQGCFSFQKSVSFGTPRGNGWNRKTIFFVSSEKISVSSFFPATSHTASG